MLQLRKHVFVFLLLSLVFSLFSSPVQASPVEKSAPLSPTSAADQRVDSSAQVSSTFTVSGTVTDSSPATGWPIYARIEARVTGNPTTPPNAVTFSNPIDGHYELQLEADVEYTLTVKAQVPGYDPQPFNTGVLTSSKTVDLSIQPNLEQCEAPGYSFDLLPSEHFDTGTAPVGWAVESIANNDALWAFNNPGHRENETGGTNGFAIADSDNAGNNQMNTTLITPRLINLTGYQNVPSINFDTLYDYWDGDFAQVEISTDNGATWLPVWYRNTDIGPAHITISLANYFTPGTTENLQVRFYYSGYYAWYWQIDNVSIGICTPRAGSFLAGYTRDENTQQPVNDAVVYSLASQADRAVSFATPDDSSVEDGLYILFSPALGFQDFQANGPSGYGGQQKNLLMTSSEITEADFTLPAGKLVTDLAGIEVSLQIGSAMTQTLSFDNTGALPAKYNLVEGIQEISPLQPLAAGFWHDASILGPDFSADNSQAAVKSPSTVSSWISATSYPMPIAEASSVALDGKIYVFGGTTGTTTLKTNYVYDPDTRAWSPIEPLPIGLKKSQVTAYQGKIYLTGGVASTGYISTALQIYDPVSNQWSAGAQVPTGSTAGSAVVLNDSIYVIGGRAGSNVTKSVYRYIPASDNWETMESLPVPVTGQSCGALLGQIYCAGGQNAAIEALKTTYAFNPLSNHWTEKADLPATMWASAYTTSNNKLFITGGIVNGSRSNVTYVYDPLIDTWSEGPTSNIATDHSASACGFYKVGGYSKINGLLSATAAVEYLPGLGSCSADHNLWLTETPNLGEINPSEQQPIEITIDAGIPEINQPGRYATLLYLLTDTPYAMINVPVTMQVLPLSTWGELKGTIRGTGYCDADPAVPLENAEVQIWSGETLVTTLLTAADGVYDWWLEAGNYRLVIKHSAFVDQQESVQVVSGGLTANDFKLRSNESCASIDQDVIDAEVVADNSVPPQTLVITNAGAGVLAYSFNWSAETAPWLSVSQSASDVEPGGTVTITINLDSTALAPKIYTADLILTTDDPNLAEKTLPVTLTILPHNYSFALTPAADAKKALPNQSSVYTLSVTNQGDVPQIYDVSAGDHTWVTNFAETLGPVAPGDSADLTVEVFVPVDAALKAVDSTTLTFKARDSAEIQHTTVLTTTADNDYNLGMSVDTNSKAALPAGRVDYVLTIENRFTSALTVEISLADNQWLAALNPSTTLVGPIAPGDSTNVTVTVNIPANAQGGAQDSLNVTARVLNDPNQPASLTLTTVAMFWHIFLPGIFR